ncbi:MAG: thiamine pyrophosphate-dependent dehydrogenase E1 component subunit alpha, partial [Magnetococcus sp. WYHC-3]
RCPVHLSIGQESIAVGACSVLESRDIIFSNHRSHAHYLAKGGDLTAMLAEIYGKDTGCCRGRGGSMHLVDRAAGVAGALPIVGGAIPLAVGGALAQRNLGTGAVVLAFLGDGALEEGVFHESANLAVTLELPVVFVCENNLYSVYTALPRRQPNRPLTDLAQAHGLPNTRGDGNDLLAVRALVGDAVARARRGGGPSFVELTTYRWLEHCGPHCDDHLGYRPPGELERWKEQCPVNRFTTWMQRQGWLEASALAALQQELHAEIDAAFTAARSAPFPEASTAAEMVYG